MPSEMSRKRSISPVAGKGSSKRLRASHTPQMSIKGSAVDAVTKPQNKPRTKIKIKSKTTSAPLSTQSKASLFQLPKLAPRGPLRRLGIAEENSIGIRVQRKDTDESLMDDKPTPSTSINQFVAINASSTKSKTRDSFEIFVTAEKTFVAVRVESNNTDEAQVKPELFTNQFKPINAMSKLPPTPRNPNRPFGPTEKKVTIRWMRSNNAVGSRGKSTAAFQDLLQSLGCQDPSFDMKTLLNLENRLNLSILRIKKEMKECGAVSFQEDDKFEKEPTFADWTVVWLENEWDGAYDTRECYADNYLDINSTGLEEEDGSEDAAVELPLNKPFEEEVELLVVNDPNEMHITVTNEDGADASENGANDIGEYRGNPYGLADWE